MKTCKRCDERKMAGCFTQGLGWCDPCIERYENECARRQAAKSLIHRTGGQARSALKGAKSPGFFRHMPYTRDEFVAHLLSTLPDGYTVQDAHDGRKLHIDHIRPIASFKFDGGKGGEDWQRCWSLANLRMLPAAENMAKNDRLSERPTPGVCPVQDWIWETAPDA